ncbi:Crp/Fnr family transcriptional regulator [Erysipelothrix urinaevulpis]|uniref:Crp/Fnr family transcriptional regulator n=1 Tax=Erysipelothrix urinaevulpis TaxID=2683717 RepID=UPI00135B5AB3|nr:Crp/Fnr family transcriptional regulator [Erysipelothrix urinaevulpis]
MKECCHDSIMCVSSVDLFNHLSQEDLKIINSLIKHRNYKKGETIFSPDDNSNLLVVESGKMKVYQLSKNGNEQLLRIVENGNYEGENQLFGVENENRYGKALDDTNLCIINQDDFKKILIQHPKIALKMLEDNAKKLQELEQQTYFLTTEKVEERLNTYLINLSKLNNSQKFKLPLMMKELAEFLGTTPETLSRKFKKIEDEGLIYRKNNMITLLKYDE